MTCFSLAAFQSGLNKDVSFRRSEFPDDGSPVTGLQNVPCGLRPAADGRFEGLLIQAGRGENYEKILDPQGGPLLRGLPYTVLGMTLNCPSFLFLFSSSHKQILLKLTKV